MLRQLLMVLPGPLATICRDYAGSWCRLHDIVYLDSSCARCYTENDVCNDALRRARNSALLVLPPPQWFTRGTLQRVPDVHGVDDDSSTYGNAFCARLSHTDDIEVVSNWCRLGVAKYCLRHQDLSHARFVVVDYAGVGDGPDYPIGTKLVFDQSGAVREGRYGIYIAR